MLRPKHERLRDQKWMDYLKTQPCILTGVWPTEYEGTDAAHIGTAGKGLKGDDNTCLPIAHSIHAGLFPSRGEITTIRTMADDDLIRLMSQAYARELYREWKESQ